MSIGQDVQSLRRVAAGIRRRVLEHTIEHGGYLSQACSAAEMLATPTWAPTTSSA